MLQDRIVGTQGVTDIAAYNSALSHITRSFAVAATIDTQSMDKRASQWLSLAKRWLMGRL